MVALTRIAVFSNAIIIAFATDLVPRLVYNSEIWINNNKPTVKKLF